MVGINRVGYPSVSQDQKKAQIINTAVKTAEAGAIIAGSAALAGKVVKNASTEGTHLFKAVASVKEFAGKVIAGVSKKVRPVALAVLIQAEVLKAQIAESKPGILIAAAAGKIGETAGKVAEKAQSVISSVKNYVSTMPKSAKIAVGVVAGLLAAASIYRSVKKDKAE